jgi:hypothetical protein
MQLDDLHGLIDSFPQWVQQLTPAAIAETYSALAEENAGEQLLMLYQGKVEDINKSLEQLKDSVAKIDKVLAAKVPQKKSRK